MDKCEICGTAEGRIYSKNNPSGKVLCYKHYTQFIRNGRCLERTRYDSNELIVYNNYADLIAYDIKNDKKFAIKIDIIDIEKISTRKWSADKGQVYSGKKHILLGRFLMGPKEEEQVIFRNKDPHDCRRENLLIANVSQKQIHLKTSSRNNSGYKGVCWDSTKKKWKAYISINKKQIRLGYFAELKDAVEVRKQAEKIHYGDFIYKEND